MLNVTNNPFMLTVIMLIVVLLSVVAPLSFIPVTIEILLSEMSSNIDNY
jgi:hypothetical protein